MSTAGSESDAAAAAHCAEMVRRFDPDRFLLAQFAPAACRPALLALAAFNLEVAKIPEVVTERMLGQIRLQWWREALDGIVAGSPRAHAVVRSLAAAVAGHGLVAEPLHAFIDARERDLDPDPPPDLPALVAHVDATAGRIAGLQLDVLGVAGDSARSAALAGTRAWALAGLLRAVPFHARARRIYLPEAVLREAGAGRADLLALRPDAGLKQAVARVAEAAAAEIEAARALGHPPRAAAAVTLAATLARLHLARLREAGHDPFAPALARPMPGRVPRLWWAVATGRV